MNRVQFVQANRILLVPLAQIGNNPFQGRVEYGDIGELANRIAAAFDSFPETLGLMQVPRGRVVNGGNAPVPFQKVAPVSEDNADWQERGLRVQLMYGHRRYEAFKLLIEQGDERYHRALMPIQITDADDLAMLLAVWEENERRQNLSAVEQAHLMASAKAALGENASQREIAEFFGLARPTVANRLSLLELPEEVQALNRTGKLSERQLLAMKPLYELDRVVEVNGREWSEQPGGWQVCTPQTYVACIVEQPEKYTSDEIREFANKVERSVGKELPKPLAEFSFAPVGMLQAGDPGYSLSALGIEQTTCKGCPFRRSGICLKPKCLQAKKDVFGRRLAYEVANELGGMAYSDDKVHFNDMSFEERDLLKASFEAGHRCEHLVVGWSDEWWGLRPFDSSGRSNGEQHYQGRNGIMLGHKGKFQAGCLKGHGAKDEQILPDLETIEAWKAAAKKQERVIKDRVRQWFLDRMAGNPDMRRMLLAFLDGGRGLGGTEEQIDRSLANYAISRIYQSSDAFTYYQTLAERIEEADFTPHAVLEYGRHEEGEAILKDAAIRVLAYWYEHRRRTWGDDAEKSQVEIERLMGLLSSRVIEDPELIALSLALDAAAKDVAQKLTKDA